MVISATETASTLDQATLDALRESVAGVLAEQCGSTELHAFIEGKNALDKLLWAQAGQLGWLGVGIPERFGGLGMGAQGLAILHGELGRQSAPGPYIATLSAAHTIVETSDDAIRQTWLPAGIRRGQCRGASNTGRAQPDPLWRRRFWHTALPGRHRRGVSSHPHGRCLGDRRPGQGRGDRGADVWDRTRDVIDVRLKDATPVGVLPDAAATRAALTRAMALAVAADSAGGARSITERTIAYMKTREQFGQPIAGFQALKHRVADLATKLAVADEMVRHAVQRIVADEPDAELWASLAKSEVTEACVFVTTDCVQLHGGVGFTWDFDPHIFLKRARLNEVLIMANTALRDQAAAALAAITASGRSALELGL
jgi:alkylation response protein AidB-like acyl-CoA dehydrogenase